MNDAHFMQAALSLGARNLGQTWPNPAVGAILVKDHRIIAEGSTGRGGRPHAETVAIEAAGASAKGATLYVTLEPCAHHGKTPPCTDAIIKTGIAKVVVACRDPHPQHGGGIQKLKASGIEVIENICAREARELNRGFFSVVEKKRPYVALKIATSADSKIACHAAARQREGGWITSESARNHGHLLRSQYDAILTGIGTVLADDPLLTCRLPGLEDRSPVRVVLDSNLRLPPDSQLAKTAKDVPVWILSSRRRPGSTPTNMEALGVKLFYPTPGTDVDPGLRRDDSINVSAALTHLTEQGITRLLVEGGQKITTAFLDSGLVDRVYWFKAPTVIGNEGLPALCGGISLPQALSRFTHEETKNLGPDTLEILCSPAS